MTNDEAFQLVASGRDELRDAFSFFDRDGDGQLDLYELRDALFRLGQPLDLPETRRLIASVTDADALTFEDFVQLVEPRPLDLDPDADVREAFAVLDANRDGYLTEEELRAAAQRSHLLPPTDVREMVQSADTDGDGRISFDEFRALLTER